MMLRVCMRVRERVYYDKSFCFCCCCCCFYVRRPHCKL